MLVGGEPLWVTLIYGQLTTIHMKKLNNTQDIKLCKEVAWKANKQELVNFCRLCWFNTKVGTLVEHYRRFHKCTVEKTDRKGIYYVTGDKESVVLMDLRLNEDNFEES